MIGRQDLVLQELAQMMERERKFGALPPMENLPLMPVPGPFPGPEPEIGAPFNPVPETLPYNPRESDPFGEDDEESNPEIGPVNLSTKSQDELEQDRMMRNYRREDHRTQAERDHAEQLGMINEFVDNFPQDVHDGPYMYYSNTRGRNFPLDPFVEPENETQQELNELFPTNRPKFERNPDVPGQRQGVGKTTNPTHNPSRNQWEQEAMIEQYLANDEPGGYKETYRVPAELPHHQRPYSMHDDDPAVISGEWDRAMKEIVDPADQEGFGRIITGDIDSDRETITKMLKDGVPIDPRIREYWADFYGDIEDFPGNPNPDEDDE